MRCSLHIKLKAVWLPRVSDLGVLAEQLTHSVNYTTASVLPPGGLCSGLFCSLSNSTLAGRSIPVGRGRGDQPADFRGEGDLVPTSQIWANAQAFTSMNNAYLAQYGVHAVVTGIAVNDEEDTVLVQV